MVFKNLFISRGHHLVVMPRHSQNLVQLVPRWNQSWNAALLLFDGRSEDQDLQLDGSVWSMDFWCTHWHRDTRPGELLHSELERSTIFNGNIPIISMAIFHCYVSSPEGMIDLLCAMLSVEDLHLQRVFPVVMIPRWKRAHVASMIFQSW